MKRIILLGAAGFLGTNLVIELAKDRENEITVVDRNETRLKTLKDLEMHNLHLVQSELNADTDYVKLIEGNQLVYHLVSSTVPTTSNQRIAEEFKENVVLSVNLLEACVCRHAEKVIFFSSGGTVYGRESRCPHNEESPMMPISSYGVQKLTIEKLLYLYNYMYDLDYRIIRLANPYGPYQRPDGVLGAVSTFTYKALRGEEIQVYGDGSVVRDFIYVDDAIRGVQKIVNGESPYRIFNLGCGYGTSIRQLLETIEKVLNSHLNVQYMEARTVDVPVSFLDISRYEAAYGSLDPLSLEKGIRKTVDFMKSYYSI